MHAVFVNFTSSVSWKDMKEQYRGFAQMLGSGGFAGCLSKTWIKRERDSIIGGFYLFQDQGAADRFLAETLEPALRGMPTVSNVRIERFEIDEEYSRITHGVPTASAVA